MAFLVQTPLLEIPSSAAKVNMHTAAGATASPTAHSPHPLPKLRFPVQWIHPNNEYQTARQPEKPTLGTRGADCMLQDQHLLTG